jgi:hypothetical protein
MPGSPLCTLAIDAQGRAQPIEAEAILLALQDGSMLKIRLYSEMGHFLRIGGIAGTGATCSAATEPSCPRCLQVFPLALNLVGITTRPAVPQPQINRGNY